ncbi:M23 family metallopeptidase [Glycomyces arizonensis]|uniref:M23 family metallopeptidase n=1 Tax=Glycomyces arizonensis TaxID=256035 RepID=UPI000686B20A|nr:M23 family metallopeptidase [Glycomyces arizonensis]
MSETGRAGAETIRRHATRPHRMRGQHRASWAAELAPLVDGTQRRYTAVVGSAVAASSIVALASAAGLPSGEPDPAASQAVADIAAIAEETSRPEAVAAPAPSGQAPTARAPAVEAPGETAATPPAETRDEQRHSPIDAQPAQIEWRPMLDHIDITSLFGRRWGRSHNGIDLAAAIGTPVYAAYPGTVEYAGWESGFGNLVVIDHGDGVETYYGHNSEVLVAKGQQVDAGTEIAKSGNTGFSLGPHVHFEVHVNGEPVEPIGYLESAGLELT